MGPKSLYINSHITETRIFKNIIESYLLVRGAGYKRTDVGYNKHKYYEWQGGINASTTAKNVTGVFGRTYFLIKRCSAGLNDLKLEIKSGDMFDIHLS